MRPTPASRPRIGLIGVTGYAQIYVDFLLAAHESGTVELVAVSVVPDQLELPVVRNLRELGLRIYADYEEMLRDEHGRLDLCFIPTGIQWHARMTIAALRAGTNVLVEKPLAGSIADCEAVRACERETGHWVAVGFQDIYAPEIAWLKEQLVDGALGRIQAVHMIGLWPRPEAYYTRNHWAGRLFSDGYATMDSPLNNAFAHFVNLALFLAGKTFQASSVVEVTECELLRAHAIESFDTAVVKARSETGVDFWLGVSHACHLSREPEIRIIGEHGVAEWFHEREYLLAPNKGPVVRKQVPNYATTRRCMFDAVLARQRDGKTPICDTFVAMAHARLIEAVHRAGVITTVDSAAIERRTLEDTGQAIPTIRGIEDAMDDACRTGASLRQIGFLPADAVSRS